MTENSSNDDLAWYGVRTFFDWTKDGSETHKYEERITVWRARSFEHAVELAENEAELYEAENGFTYMKLAQGFHTFIETKSIVRGSEVFSLIRDTDLEPEEYLDTFFDTGGERQGWIAAD